MRTVLVHTLAWCATCSVLWAGPAAQDPEPAEPTRAQMERIERVLVERKRGTLHPSPDPVHLVGIGEGDNDFLAATPALKHGLQRAAQVSPDENRDRRLALYEDRARFTNPVRRVGGWATRTPEARATRRSTLPTEPQEPEDAPLSALATLVATLVVLSILGYTVWTLYRPKGAAEA